MENYLSEAFKSLDILDEDVFEVDKDGLTALKDFEDKDEDDNSITVVDPDSETEEDLEDSYIGKVILDCSVCHTDIYKDKEDVVIDEESDLANIGEECPYCYSSEGFKVIGEVKPFVETEFETDDDVDVSVDGEKVEVEEEDESLRRKRLKESDNSAKFYLIDFKDWGNRKGHAFAVDTDPDNLTDNPDKAKVFDDPRKAVEFANEYLVADGEKYDKKYLYVFNESLRRKRIIESTNGTFRLNDVHIRLDDDYGPKSLVKDWFPNASYISIVDYDDGDGNLVAKVEGSFDCIFNGLRDLSMDDVEGTVESIMEDNDLSLDEVKKLALEYGVLDEDDFAFYLDESLQESINTSDIVSLLKKYTSGSEAGRPYQEFMFDNTYAIPIKDSIKHVGRIDSALKNDGFKLVDSSSDGEYFAYTKVTDNGDKILAGIFYNETDRGIDELVLQITVNPEDKELTMYFDESLHEDTVKQGKYWVNKGDEGTHGKFRTKKAADAQRKAMFAGGFKAKSLKESIKNISDALDDFTDVTGISLNGDEDTGFYFENYYDAQSLVDFLEENGFSSNVIKLDKDDYYANDFSFIVEIINEFNNKDNNKEVKLGDFKIKDGVLLSYSGEDETVVIPNNVKHISSNVFAGKHFLKNVVFPKNLESIYTRAFLKCKNLVDIILPKNLKYIDTWAFSECDSLTNVDIPGSVEVIGDYAFSYCRLLKSISIPSSIRYIGYDAFFGCDSLSDIYYSGSEEDFENIEIKGKKLSNANIHFNSIKESLKESCSINQCQKWVDYDMKKYKRISNDTMEKIKSSGYSVVKDQYGDYEVIANRKDESLKESADIDNIPEIKNLDVGGSYANARDIKLALNDTGLDKLKIRKLYVKSGIFDDEDIRKDLKELYGWNIRTARDNSNFKSEFYVFEKIKPTKDESCGKRKSRKMKESIEDITIDTGDQEISVSARDKEKKSDGEMIAPLSDEMKADIEMNSDDVDVDVDEFSEEDFDELGESYLKKVYENVKGYKTTSIATKGNKLFIEGLIKFNSGKEKKTSFVFESRTITKSGKAKLIGENLQISRGHKSFKLTGTINNGKFISESLNYNYRVKNGSESQRVYGTAKKSK